MGKINLDTCIWMRRVPQINSATTSLQDLINWNGEEIHEPARTSQMPQDAMWKFINEWNVSAQIYCLWTEKSKMCSSCNQFMCTYVYIALYIRCMAPADSITTATIQMSGMLIRHISYNVIATWQISLGQGVVECWPFPSAPGKAAHSFNWHFIKAI